VRINQDFLYYMVVNGEYLNGTCVVTPKQLVKNKKQNRISKKGYTVNVKVMNDFLLESEPYVERALALRNNVEDDMKIVSSSATRLL
jgi:hypothetical protein